MKINKFNLIFFMLLTICIVLLVHAVISWNPLPVEDDHKLFMPGTQPGEAGTFESPGKCDNCHGGYNQAVEPAYTWRGSMMAQAARDPLWLACLTTANQDSIYAVGNPNAGDLCIRCHSPTGWLEGRSDPTNTQDLRTDDFWGVQCDFCHRMLDPFAELGQPDVPEETDPIAQSMEQETKLRDIQVLSTLTLFDGTPFLDSNTNLPIYYGDGNFSNYIENGAGQFFVDSGNAKRGPFYDAEARHKMYYSRYHKSQTFCSACHDVSNPILASLDEIDKPEKQAPQTYYHVERTSSEFLLSAYGSGGASTNIPGVPFADKCQDCHMRDVTGKGCNKKGTPIRDDLPLHDLTGGNYWISKILASVDQTGPVYDTYNYNILSGAKYDGATIDVTGIQGHGQALADGSNRAIQQLQMAANLSIISEDTSSITLRVQNNGGHKLISGFPEGRRMFLNVKFFDIDNNLIGEINPYYSLITTQDQNGNEIYQSGGYITNKTEELVWEAEMASSITGEEKSFHLKGFDTGDEMYTRLVQPRWEGADAPDYFTADEYAGGYDEITISKPENTNSWYATLCYQTTSKEYIEFLRDEINGDASTLPPEAYIVQTDPFFANLKGWGDAIWDIWLHNNGCEPVVMTQIGETPEPPCNIDNPQNLQAAGGKRSVTLTWNSVTDADGYNIFYSQNGKYTYIDSTTDITFKDRRLKTGQTFCYVVTAYRTCSDGSLIESDYSNEACAVAN
jgi:hypothetical protein